MSGNRGRIGWDRRVLTPSGTRILTREEADDYKERLSEYLHINDDIKTPPEAINAERVSRLQSAAVGDLRAQGHKRRDDVQRRRARLNELREVIEALGGLPKMSAVSAAWHLKRNHPQFSNVSVSQLRQDIATIKKVDGHSKTKK